MPVSPGAVLPREMNSTQWAEFLRNSGIQGDRTVKTFTPTGWTDFSVDPTGDISYYDFGVIVAMWSAAGLTGTSDGAGMSFSGVPAAITPTDGNRFARCLVITGGYTVGGTAELTIAGVMQFYIEDTSGAFLGTADDDRTVNFQNFATTAGKGLPAGWFIMYPK